MLSKHLKKSINKIKSILSIGEARQIWEELYLRTGNHKALHQVGYVYRSAGQFNDALRVYQDENKLVNPSDKVAIAANLYELTYCNFLDGRVEQAFHYFKKYEKLEAHEFDLVERGCFYRLKGDLQMNVDLQLARNAYLESMKYFKDAKDELGVAEVESRLSVLG